MVYYSKYPFSKEAEDKLRSMSILKKPLDELYNTTIGKRIFELAISRIRCALMGEEYLYTHDIEFLLSYFISKIILYNIKHNSQFIKKFIEYETNRVYTVIVDDRGYNEFDYEKISEDFDFVLEVESVKLGEYLKLRKYLTDKKYKLVNRHVVNGMVMVSDINKDVYLKSKINAVVTKDVDNAMKMKQISDIVSRNSNFKEILENISIGLYEDYQLNIRTDYGEIENEHFPPCVNDIMNRIKNNAPVAHQERFFITTFLKEVGMTTDEIVVLFSNSPKFNYNQTLYQIKHIIGEESVDKYVVPMCSTAKTFGYCKCGTNALCKKIKHPLGYYIVAKKKYDKCSTEKKNESVIITEELPNDDNI